MEGGATKTKYYYANYIQIHSIKKDSKFKNI